MAATVQERLHFYLQTLRGRLDRLEDLIKGCEVTIEKDPTVERHRIALVRQKQRMEEIKEDIDFLTDEP